MVNETVEPGGMHRRDFLKWTGVGAVALSMTPFAVEATPDQVAEALAKLIGKTPLKEGRISITLPEIAENGSVVPLAVEVAGPMNADDYVKAIHIFADGNPLPDVASYYLGPNNGKARISLRIRLLKTQKIVFVAETSKGEAFTARQQVKVTLGGCGG